MALSIQAPDKFDSSKLTYLGRHDSITPGCVHQVIKRDLAGFSRWSNVSDRVRSTAFLTIGLSVLEKHFRHLMFLENGGSTLGGVPQEEFVELGADLHNFSVHLDGQ